jgi:L-asparagine transporter-like permease
VTAVFNVPAVLVTIAVTALLIIGVSESASVNAVIVVIKVSVVLIVIGAGVFFIVPANWHPFVPPNAGQFGEYGWSGVLRGAAVIFFAYLGFDAVSTSAQEAKDPQRDMPRGILGSLVICTVLYVLVSGVMVGLVPYKQMLNQPAPLVIAIDAAAGRAVGTSWEGPMSLLRMVVTIGALAGLSSVMVVMMMAQPRIFLAMSKDGLFPRWASRLHPRFRTPHVSTLVTGAVVALASGLTPIGTLGNLVNIGTLMAFAIVSIGIIVLRRTRPDLPRPFRVPFVPVLPILSALVSFLLMLSLPWATWERLIIWMVIGIVFYFTYGYRRSHVRVRLKPDTTTVRSVRLQPDLRNGPALVGRPRLPDDELALHLLAALVLREVAVVREAAGLVGAELEDHGLSVGGALRDAIWSVDREAVGKILGAERNANQVVLLHLDACGREGELVADDGDFANLTLRPRRGAGPDRGGYEHDASQCRSSCPLPLGHEGPP